MSSRSAIYRKNQKKKDPQKYENYLKKQKEAAARRNAAKKRLWEETKHTRAQINARNAEVEAKRKREQERYVKKKNENSRQTRKSARTVPVACCVSSQPPSESKRPKDMTEEEFREHRAKLRREQRSRYSHQKKTAVRLKDRMRKRQYNETRRSSLDSTSSTSSSCLRQSLNNLSHDFKKRTKQLGVTSEEYARAVLNLLNPITREKKAAIKEYQKTHPCRCLFLDGEEEEEEESHDLEGELGIDVIDKLVCGPPLESVAKPVHQQIKMYYVRDDVSRMLPHARYTTKHGPARVMIITIKEAHQLFLQENPSVKICLTLFQMLRPKNVRLLWSVALDTCLCIFCTNIRLKIVQLNKVLGASGTLPSEAQMLRFLACIPEDPEEKCLPNIKCVDGECPVCKDRIRPFKIFCRDVNNAPIRWQRWEKKDGGKSFPIQKEGTVRDLVNELEGDLTPARGNSFLQHLYTAYWQYRQYIICRTNPEEGEIVMVQDFGENRKAAYAQEIKSAHFGKGQITVHPVVCFYRLGGEVVRDSLVFLSDDTQNDHHAVNTFIHKTLEVLKEKLLIKKVTLWSDGAASQYKGRGTFCDLSHMLDVPTQSCFYGSEHGKGEADGETGVMSQALKRAVYEGVNFSSAQDMVMFLSNKLGHERRQYILITDINRNDSDLQDVQAIQGTRKFHQFQGVEHYVVRARRFACFCSACRDGLPDKCMNSETVGSYSLHHLRTSVTSAGNEETATTSQTQTMESKDESAAKPCPKVGDYVKLTCSVNKLKKTYFAVVIGLPDDNTDSFSVRFMERSGSKYVFGEHEDVGLICKGPPDYYEWEPVKYVMIDHRRNYSFV